MGYSRYDNAHFGILLYCVKHIHHSQAKKDFAQSPSLISGILYVIYKITRNHFLYDYFN